MTSPDTTHPDALDHALKHLLRMPELATQQALCEQLSAAGFAVNQSKISRLLRKVGAVKTKNSQGQLVYMLPQEPAPPSMSAPVSELITHMTHNETTIIIHTTPGAASMIARLLDYQRQHMGIAGVISGDDTIFIAPLSIHNIELCMNHVADILEQPRNIPSK